MSARFEAIALKKLQEIIHDRGISAEAIFSKFDNNGDGSLDVEEFKRAVASITGQNAPDAIIRAVFSALDSDGNQGLDLAELIALVEGGQAPAVSGEVTEIEISDHTNSNFNGVYYKQDNPINGNPSFSKPKGQTLYFYDMSDGGAKSWSLHSNRVDGSEDLYDGGWTRPPSSGGIPLGTRRWVGVGMLTINAVGVRSSPNVQEAKNEDTQEIRIELEKGVFMSNESIQVNFTTPTLAADSWLGIVPADTEHRDSTANLHNRVSYLDMEGQSIGTHNFENPGVGDWTFRLNNESEEIAYVEFSVEAAETEVTPPATVEDFSSEHTVEPASEDGLYSVDRMMSDLGPNFTNDLENLLSNPNQSLDEARAAADEMAEAEIEELPFLFRAPARRIWDTNADSILAKIVENLPPPEDLAKAAALASVVGVGAATVAAQAGLDAQSPQEAVVGAVVNTVVDHAAEAVLETVTPIEEDPISEVKTQEHPEPESIAEVSGLDLVQVAASLNEARYLNDQIQIIESAKGQTAFASVRVEKIERTFSIGIEDEYRGGKTIIGSIEGVGDVEVHLKPSAEISELRPNHNSALELSVHKWNGIRKRLELYAQ